MAIATGARRHDPLRRAWRALIIVVSLAVGAKLLALNLADLAATNRSSLLLQLTASYSPSAAAVAAEKEFEAGRADDARRFALASARDRPIAAPALRTLGLSAEIAGDREFSAEAMSLSGALGWRDTPTQLWLLIAYVASGDYASALLRADALLRRRQFVDEAMAIMMAAAVAPASQAPLMERLSHNPTWRASFFEAVHDLPAQRLTAFQLFLDRLAAAGPPLPHSELEGLATRLYEVGRHQEAREFWRNHLASPEMGAAHLFDGGFSMATLEAKHRSPFEWEFPQSPGSEIILDRPLGVDGTRALQATTRVDARVDIARQSLALQPGTYVLSYDGLSDRDILSENYHWALECSGGAEITLTRPIASLLPNRWTRVSYVFAVPGRKCKAQRITFLIRGGHPRSASLWVDNVVVRERQRASGS